MQIFLQKYKGDANLTSKIQSWCESLPKLILRRNPNAVKIMTSISQADRVWINILEWLEYFNPNHFISEWTYDLKQTIPFNRSLACKIIKSKSHLIQSEDFVPSWHMAVRCFDSINPWNKKNILYIIQDHDRRVTVPSLFFNEWWVMSENNLTAFLYASWVGDIIPPTTSNNPVLCNVSLASSEIDKKEKKFKLVLSMVS